MAKVDIALQMLRERFTEALREDFAAKFDGREITTTYNIFHSCYVSTPDDGEDFTPEQISFISGYETAWLKATNVVAEER